MSLKNTKIYISEIPKEWTKRLRSGHRNIWNEKSTNPELPEMSLYPPTNGLYAERFDDGWYWVCGCNKCLENGEPWSYIVCEEHNRCITCGAHRKELTETPWGHREGFQCKPCHETEHDEHKQEAIRLAKENGHDEWDCYREDKIICPVCASVNSSDDIHESNEDMQCNVCDSKFAVEVDYEIKYTTTLS